MQLLCFPVSVHSRRLQTRTSGRKVGPLRVVASQRENDGIEEAELHTSVFEALCSWTGAEQVCAREERVSVPSRCTPHSPLRGRGFAQKPSRAAVGRLWRTGDGRGVSTTTFIPGRDHRRGVGGESPWGPSVALSVLNEHHFC